MADLGPVPILGMCVCVSPLIYKHTFKNIKNITRDFEIKNIVTIARGVWEGDSGERGL